MVRRIRRLPGHGPRFLVTGETAGELDFLAQIEGRAPWAVAFVFAASYLVLAVAFRSVLLPVKAIVMNSLSIAGAFGVLVWVFQDGHLSGFVGLTKLGYIESTMPVVIVCTLFGVSMDYEVFMLSRISEAYRAGATNRDAVAIGLVATGPHHHIGRLDPGGGRARLHHRERGDREGARPRASHWRSASMPP